MWRRVAAHDIVRHLSLAGLLISFAIQASIPDARITRSPSINDLNRSPPANKIKNSNSLPTSCSKSLLQFYATQHSLLAQIVNLLSRRRYLWRTYDSKAQARVKCTNVLKSIQNAFRNHRDHYHHLLYVFSFSAHPKSNQIQSHPLASSSWRDVVSTYASTYALRFSVSSPAISTHFTWSTSTINAATRPDRVSTTVVLHRVSTPRECSVVVSPSLRFPLKVTALWGRRDQVIRLGATESAIETVGWSEAMNFARRWGGVTIQWMNE